MGPGRAVDYPPWIYLDPSNSQQLVAESMNLAEELAMLKKQASVIETQMHEINARIRVIEECQDVTAQIAEIDTEKCTRCLRCCSACPVGAIAKDEDVLEIDTTKCTGCGICMRECPQDAIYLKKV